LIAGLPRALPNSGCPLWESAVKVELGSIQRFSAGILQRSQLFGAAAGACGAYIAIRVGALAQRSAGQDQSRNHDYGYCKDADHQAEIPPCGIISHQLPLVDREIRKGRQGRRSSDRPKQDNAHEDRTHRSTLLPLAP